MALVSRRGSKSPWVPVLIACFIFACGHEWLLRYLNAEVGDSMSQRAPGLIVETTAGHAAMRQFTGRIAHWMVAEESSHPWSAEYTGEIEVTNPGTYHFSATVIGRLELNIGGRQVLVVDNTTSPVPMNRQGDPIELASGPVSIVARFTAIEQRSAVLRLFWRRPDGFEESMMPSAFSHALADEKEIATIARGTKLIIQSRCTACHDSEITPKADRFHHIRRAIPLNSLAEGLSREWLFEHLENPIRHRHNSGMPRLFHDQKTSKTEIAAVIDYLKSLTRDSDVPEVLAPDKSVRSLTSDQRAEARKRFARRGCVACHAAPNEPAEFVTVNSGPTDEGAPARPTALAMDPIPLHQLAAKYRPAQLKNYLVGSHVDARVPQSARQHHPPLDFRRIEEEEVQNLVNYLLDETTHEIRHSRTTIASPSDEDVRLRFLQLVPTPTETAKFDDDNSLQKRISLGRRLVESRGCQNCHSVPDTSQKAPAIPTLSTVASAVNGNGPFKGCLAEAFEPAVPDFGFSREDCDAIAMTLQDWARNRTADIIPSAQLENQLRQLGCTNCHERGARGSMFSHRIEAFDSLGRDTTLRDITPPSLDGIGEHLNPDWLRRVLLDHRRIRPWLDLTMPLYRPDEVESLIEQLIRTDGIDPKALPEVPIAGTEIEVSAARLLIGQTGLNCIGCHDFAEHRASGVRAPDLTTTPQRLRFPWFQRWLHAPQELARGTRMPSIFMNGRSAAPSVLNGDEPTQVRALWNYLAHRPQNDMPLLPKSGRSQSTPGEPEAPTPTDRPLLEYGFLPGHAGLKGLAVGFPTKLHFAWNTETCQLTRVWQGDFIHHEGWTGSGKGGVEANALVILGKIVWRNDEEGQLRLTDSHSEQVPIERPNPRFEESFATRDAAGIAWSTNYAGARIRIEEQIEPTANRGPVAFRHRLRLRALPAGTVVWRRIVSGVRRDHVLELPNDESRGWSRIQQNTHDWLICTSEPNSTVTWKSRILKQGNGFGDDIWLQMIPNHKAPELCLDLEVVRVDRGASIPIDQSKPIPPGGSR